jgi:ribosomal protein S18 acetylase RimI-like enzyme
MKIRSIMDSDLSVVADIHSLVFPDSALSQFGVKTIQRYYSYQLNGPHDTLCICALDDSKITGFCFAGIFRGAETGFLLQNRNYLIWRLVTHPWLFTNEMVRKRMKGGIQNLWRYKQQSIELPITPRVEKFGVLSIAVHPQFHGRGIGKLLMKDIEKKACQKGFSSMRLSVRQSNLKAVLFYEKLGWRKIVATDGIWWGLMVYDMENGDNGGV